MTKEYEAFKPFEGQKVAIVHDSSSSLPEKYRIGYEGLSEVPFKINNGSKTWYDTPFESDEEKAEFLADLDEYIATTSLPSPGEYANVYEEIINNGIYEIAVIPMSSGMSGSMNSATQAAKMLEGKANISVADVKTVSVGQGLLVTQADIENRHGEFESADELTGRVEQLSNGLYVAQAFSDLKHLHRGGRIGAASKMIGGLFDVIPVIGVGKDGKLQPITKKRGWKKAHRAIIEHVAEGVASHDTEGILGNVAVRLAFVNFDSDNIDDLRNKVYELIPENTDPIECQKAKFNIATDDKGNPYEILDCEENMVIGTHSGGGVNGFAALVVPERPSVDSFDLQRKYRTLAQLAINR